MPAVLARARRTLSGAALAAALVAGGGALAACDDGGSTYDKSDPMPAESSAPSSTPNPALGGAGQNLPMPPSADTNGITGGEEETGNQGK